MSKSIKQRRLRLFGGTVDKEGGGMPLPSIVSQMLNHIQDNGPTRIADLVAMVEDHHHKRERVEYIYFKGHKLEGDAYELFIGDIVDELEDAGVAIRQDDRLAPGPAFMLGEPLPLRSGMGATIYPKTIREFIGEASQRSLDIKSLAHDLREDRPGLRSINKDNLAVITESMRAFGYMPQYPVLKDQHGRILSGRHRIAAAKAVGIQYETREIKVASDLEAIAIAYTANEASGFSKEERRRIAKRLGIAPENLNKFLGTEAKRNSIRAELLKDPKQADRAIAAQFGVSKNTVEAERLELEAGGQIDHVDLRTGADDKVYPARKPRNGEAINPNSTGGRILLAVEQSGDQGLTVQEVRQQLTEAGFEVDPQTVNSALHNLSRIGKVASTGEKRKTENVGGRRATVYVAAKDQPGRSQIDKYEKIVERILRLSGDLPKSYRERIISKWSQEC